MKFSFQNIKTELVVIKFSSKLLDGSLATIDWLRYNTLWFFVLSNWKCNLKNLLISLIGKK